MLLAGCSFLPPTTELPRELEPRIHAIGGEVARLRELPVLHEVPAGLQKESEIRESMRASIEKEWDAEAQAVERVYKILGLLPDQLDTKRYLIDFYTGQVAGYYDPESKKFFLKLSESTPRREADFTIAHEFAHALQDQHFDLEGIHRSLETNEDETLAANALIEGDAMLAGIDHYAFRLGAPASAINPLSRILVRSVLATLIGNGAISDDPSEQVQQAPPVLARQLTFPYLEGSLFASAVRAEFGQAGLDAAFRDLPESTEQVLHPERYTDRRDRPVAIVPAPPPRGWTTVVEQTLGMLSLQVLLREYLGSGAERFAEGWDGDRYALWRAPDGSEVLAWVSVWDYVDQAARFAAHYRELLHAQRPAADYTVLQVGDLVVAVSGSADSAALANHLLASDLRRSADDQPPLRFMEQALRWPISVERLDRVFQVQALGGQLFALRSHSGGFSLGLLHGGLLRAEKTPDRSHYSALAGLVWTSSDRAQGYRAASIPVLLTYQQRNAGADSCSELSLLGPAGLHLAWGPGSRRGRRLGLGFLHVPFL